MTRPHAAPPIRSRRLRALAVVSAAALGLSGCSFVSPGGSEAAAPPTTRRRDGTSTTSSSTTTTTTTTTTTVPTAAATPVTTPPPGMGQGASGAGVLALEQRLAELRFDVGKVDGSFDAVTRHAVMAFQKFHGLERTGRATDDVVAALATATLAGAMFAEGGPNRVEIDLKRQILMLFQNGELVRVLSASTGNQKRYCVDGECARAVTPGGSFKVTRKIKGLRVSRLGKLYNPLYFNGGIAIHGSPSVPAGPASHGCVRIPMSASLWFHETVPKGTPVYVLGGSRAPVPFNEQAPPEEATVPVPAPAPLETPTTTTTVAPVAPLVPVEPEPTPAPLLPLPAPPPAPQRARTSSP